ncbi:MAG: hypothetical protein AB1657_04955 [Candidatus Micrarchaeota archaeon]
MCAEFAYPKIFVGKERPPTQRMIGLRVHPEERKRVDAFIFSFPERSRERLFAVSCLTEGRRGNPVDLSDADYFGIVRRRLWEMPASGRVEIGAGGAVNSDVLRRVANMPAWVQGDALRVLIGMRGEENACGPREFAGALLRDEMENTPGGKEEQILLLLRRHVQKAASDGRIGRAGVSGTMFPFEEWLRAAGIEDVNLFYYGSAYLERLMDAADRARDFGTVGRMLHTRDGAGILPLIAGKMRAFPAGDRIGVIGIFAHDAGRRPEEIEKMAWELDVSYAAAGALLY